MQLDEELGLLLLRAKYFSLVRRMRLQRIHFVERTPASILAMKYDALDEYVEALYKKLKTSPRTH